MSTGMMQFIINYDQGYKFDNGLHHGQVIIDVLGEEVKNIKRSKYVRKIQINMR